MLGEPRTKVSSGHDARAPFSHLWHLLLLSPRPLQLKTFGAKSSLPIYNSKIFRGPTTHARGSPSLSFKHHLLGSYGWNYRHSPIDTLLMALNPRPKTFRKWRVNRGRTGEPPAGPSWTAESCWCQTPQWPKPAPGPVPGVTPEPAPGVGCVRSLERRRLEPARGPRTRPRLDRRHQRAAEERPGCHEKFNIDIRAIGGRARGGVLLSVRGRRPRLRGLQHRGAVWPVGVGAAQVLGLD